MASDFDFSPAVIDPIVWDRVERGGRAQDNLPRRRYLVREKPGRKDSGDAPPEDITTSAEEGTEEHRLDLEA